jgi:hypothetical protein
MAISSMIPNPNQRLECCYCGLCWLLVIVGLLLGFLFDSPNECLLFDMASTISISCTSRLGLLALSWSSDAPLEACEGALCSWNRLRLGITLSCFLLSVIILSTYIWLLVR